MIILMVWSGLVVEVVRKPPAFALGWDSFGYWLYLPAMFIQNDPFLSDVGWVEDARVRYDASGTLYQVTTVPEGGKVIRYPIGLAVTWLPWFAVGHVAANVMGYPTDGFAAPYQWAVRIGVMLYFLIGLLLLRSVLARCFNQTVAWIVPVLLLFGTNLIDQALNGQTMPHLTLFTLYAAVLFFTMRWRSINDLRQTVPLALTMGMATLVRPTEVVCVLIPLFWRADRFLGIWRQHLQAWAGIGAMMFCMGCIQFVYWKLATGHWFLDTYGNPGEGLDLLQPHTIPFLFSFRKGWLVYTPMMLFAFIGVWMLLRDGRKEALPVAFFCALHLYIVSSWTCWWYADSYSSRAMVGAYPIWAVPLGYIMFRSGNMRTVQRALFIGAVVFLSVLNLFQFWQYGHGLIHPSRMTRGAYFSLWGRTTRPEGLDEQLLVERSTTGKESMAHGMYVVSKVIGVTDTMAFARNTAHSDDVTFNTAEVDTVDATHPFSAAMSMSFKEITDQDHAFLELRWLIRRMDTIPGTLAVATFDHGGSYGYRTEELQASSMIGDGWEMITTWYLTPEVRNRNDRFSAYLWSTKGASVQVMGPAILVHERRQRNP